MNVHDKASKKDYEHGQVEKQKIISKKNPNQPTLENRYSTFNVGAEL